MALLSNTYSVNHSLTISLTFEDGTVKKNTITEGDLISVTYNKNGLRTAVEGVITRLFPSGTESCSVCGCNVCESQWSIVIDGSSYGFDSSIKISEGKILDLTLEKSASMYEAISSPVGDNRITDFKLVGDVLMLSPDNGSTWLKVVQLPAIEVTVADADKEMATKIAALLPSGLRPDERAALILNILALVKEVKSGATTTTAATSYSLTEQQIKSIVTEVVKETSSTSSTTTTGGTSSSSGTTSTGTNGSTT